MDVRELNKVQEWMRRAARHWANVDNIVEEYAEIIAEEYWKAPGAQPLYIPVTVDESEGALPLGMPLPKTPMVTLTVCMPPELYDRATKTAAECGVSLSQFCRDALRDHLFTWGDPEKEASK